MLGRYFFTSIKIIVIPIFTILLCCQKKEVVVDDYLRMLLSTHSAPIGLKSVRVAYFDGDCALCLEKMASLEKDYASLEDESLYFIAASLDSQIFRINASNVNLRSPIIVTGKDLLLKDLTFNEQILIDEKYRIKTKAKIQ